jgi:hypothetical protein
MCRLSSNMGASTFLNHQGLSRPVMGLLYLYLSGLNKRSRTPELHVVWVAVTWKTYTGSKISPPTLKKLANLVRCSCFPIQVYAVTARQRCPKRCLDSITPWSRFHLEQLTGSQIVKKFPAFYGNRSSYRFHKCPPPVFILSRIVSVYTPNPTSWRSILILSV